MKNNPQPEELERKVLSVAYFKVLDAKQGILEAIVSVFDNVDMAGERVKLGFFTESLAEKYPKGVWMHDWATPVAKTLEAKELEPGNALLPAKIKKLGGLYIKGQFNLNTQRGREAFSDIEFGIIDEFSIGYQTLEDNTEDGVRDLIKGRLYEWSPVLVGCNPLTAPLGTKKMPKDQTPAAPAADNQPAIEAAKGFELPAEFKGQYLGEYIEGQMTYGALSTLVDALFYNVFYECIYGAWDWDDDAGDYIRSTMSVEEGVARLEGALDEFSALVIAAYQALMKGSGAEAVSTAKDMRASFAKPETKDLTVSSHAGEVFAKHSEQVLASVQEFTERAAAIKALRAKERKEGRVLSESMRQRLSAHVDALKTATKTVEDILADTQIGTSPDATSAPSDHSEPLGDKASPDEANAAYGRFLELEAKALGVTF